MNLDLFLKNKEFLSVQNTASYLIDWPKYILFYSDECS